MNRDVLYHSATYLGQDYSDGIRHFKYISKKRVNGRWVYYYKNDKLNNLKAKANFSSQALRVENKRRGYGNDDYAYGRHNGKDVTDSKYNKIASKAMSSHYIYNKAKEKDDKRKKMYNNTAIKALNTLSDASYNVSKSVKKGKKNIEKSINKGKKKLNKLWSKIYNPTHKVKNITLGNTTKGTSTVTAYTKTSKKPKPKKKTGRRR